MEPFTILPYDRALCTKWAEILVAAQNRGFRIECADAWIAAAAVLYDLPVVTHNRSDYRGVRGWFSFLTAESHNLNTERRLPSG